MDKIKNIKRHDYSRCHGWNFRVRCDNVYYSKLFSDGVYGGSDNALKAAVSYKKMFCKDHTPRTIYYHTRNKKSKTNAIGLSICCQQHNGYIAGVGWIASVMCNGKQKKYYYSILKWGYNGAYQLARTDRINYTKTISVPVKVPPPPNWLITFLKEYKR
jgi:hypothetical protein